MVQKNPIKRNLLNGTMLRLLVDISKCYFRWWLPLCLLTLYACRANTMPYPTTGAVSSVSDQADGVGWEQPHAPPQKLSQDTCMTPLTLNRPSTLPAAQGIRYDPAK